MTSYTFSSANIYNVSISGPDGSYEVHTIEANDSHDRASTETTVSNSTGTVAGKFIKPVSSKYRGLESVAVGNGTYVQATSWLSTSDPFKPFANTALKFKEGGKTYRWTSQEKSGQRTMKLHAEKTLIAEYKDALRSSSSYDKVKENPVLTLHDTNFGDITVFSLILAEQIRDRKMHALQDPLTRELGNGKTKSQRSSMINGHHNGHSNGTNGHGVDSKAQRPSETIEEVPNATA